MPWLTYTFASNIMMYTGRIFEPDVDKERRGGEQVRVDLGDGTCEFITLRGADGFPERHDVPWHGV